MTRSIVRIGLAVVLALVCTCAVLAQKGKPPVSPGIIYVNIALDNSSDKAIRPEAAGTIPAETPYPGRLWPYLREGTVNTYYYRFGWEVSLSTRSSLENQRSVVFKFDYRNPNGNGMVPCYPTSLTPDPSDAAKGPYMFPVPEFLLNSPYTPDGNQKPISVSVTMDVEWTLEAGHWVRSDTVFDLGQYFVSPGTAKPVAYVSWLVMFTTPELDAKGATAYIAHNGPASFTKVMGYTRGLVQVVKRDNGGFVVRPIPADVLNGTTFPPIYQSPPQYPPDSIRFVQTVLPDHANLSLSVPLPGKAGYKAINAVCDLGPFLMPFEMTVTKK